MKDGQIKRSFILSIFLLLNVTLFVFTAGSISKWNFQIKFVLIFNKTNTFCIVFKLRQQIKRNHPQLYLEHYVEKSFISINHQPSAIDLNN